MEDGIILRSNEEDRIWPQRSLAMGQEQHYRKFNSTDQMIHFKTVIFTMIHKFLHHAVIDLTVLNQFCQYFLYLHILQLYISVVCVCKSTGITVILPTL